MKSHLQATVRRIARRFLVMVLVLATTLSSMSGSAHARFISPDDWDPTLPGVGTNRYAYAYNDPINKSDPNGHQAEEAVVGGVLSTAIAGCAASGGCGIAVAALIGAGIAVYSVHAYFSGPAPATKVEMAGKTGIYTGAGSYDDWGNKGAHWKGVDSKGQQHEIGIRPGKTGDFEFEPVGGAVPGKAFDQAIDSLGPTLGSQKGLEKLQEQVQGALDKLQGRRGFEDKKKELKDLSDLISDKLSSKENDKKGKSDGGSSDRNKNDSDKSTKK